MNTSRPTFINRLTYDKHVAGVDCVIKQDGTLSFTAVILTKKGSKIILGQKSEAGINFERLKVFLKKEIPIALTVNGKGILHKKLSRANDKEDIGIESVLPGAKADDFYLQQMEGYNDFQFISFIRRNQLDEILTSFLEKGFWVVTGAIGPAPLQNILPYSDIDPNVGRTLHLPGFSIQILGDLIDAYSTSSEINPSFELLFGEERVGSDHLLAYASAFSRFQSDKPAFLSESIKKRAYEFHYQKIFRRAGTGVAGFFFILLFSNYLLFNKYASEFSELNYKVSFSSDLSKQADTLRLQIQRKETFLKDIGMLESSRLSYFADQLAFDFPASLLLKEVRLNPAEHTSDFDEEKLSFRQNTLIVKGSCWQSTDLNEWIGKIKKKGWVEEVSLTNLVQDKLIERGEFSIEIAIR
jgi:hypothetical protein